MPLERIFSAAGLLINKLRNRLSSDIVDSIIFLNKNSIPQDIKTDATEGDFANVIGMKLGPEHIYLYAVCCEFCGCKMTIFKSNLW